MIVDVPGWGRRGEYVEADQPLDPAKQKRDHRRHVRRAAEPDGWLDLGPVDGYRLLPHGPAGLPDPLHPRRRPDQYRPDRDLPAAARQLQPARHRRGQQGRGLDHAGQRPPGELRPLEVQGAADRAERRDRQAVRRGLDAAPLPRAAIRRRRPGRQRRPRLLRLGRPLQHAGPRQRRADRHHQWQRDA